MARQLRFLIALALLILVATSSSQLYAVPFDITHDYYVGECGYLADWVGFWNKTCSGSISQYGQQSGDWRVSTWYNCVTSSVNVRYYQWCGGAWVEVSQSYFENECGCA